MRVVVRFRPINERERQEEKDTMTHGNLSDMSVDFPHGSIGVNVMQGGKMKNTFVLDSVLQASVTQVCTLFLEVMSSLPPPSLPLIFNVP